MLTWQLSKVQQKLKYYWFLTRKVIIYRINSCIANNNWIIISVLINDWNVVFLNINQDKLPSKKKMIIQPSYTPTTFYTHIHFASKKKQ